MIDRRCPMREIAYQDIVETVRQLCIEANCVLPEDVCSAICAA